MELPYKVCNFTCNFSFITYWCICF